MENENACIFTLITRLCEKILDESWKHNDRSTSRTLLVKKMRTKVYSTLLIPGNNEFPHGSHDCFVKVISTAFENRILQDNVCLEEFDRCVDQLWQGTSERSYIPPMMYFLAKMCNERTESGVDGNDNFYGNGISSSIVPRKYHLYHPSLFILPNLHSVLSNNSRVNYLPSSQFLQDNLIVRPVCNFQYNAIGTKFSGRKNKQIPSVFPSIARDQNDITWNHLEDEGYESTGTTPLLTTPAESSALPWYELDVDLNINQKARHHTWESLGKPVQTLEHPPLFEAGLEALHCNLKIREKLLLTLEPRISLHFRDPTDWKILVHHVMCLLMGLESEGFIFNEELDRFELVEGVWLENISHEALLACLGDIIVMGTCFRRLLLFVESRNGHNQGAVLTAIKKCTRQYLLLYQGVCLLVMHDLLQNKSISILLMRLKLRSLQEQILCLARAFGLLGSGPPLPTGVEALSHLHQHASSAQRQQVAALFHYLLHAGCLVYFSILERWVFDGEVIDGGDFFVLPRLEYLSCHNRRFWTRAFQFNSATVPEFLCGLKPFLLRCGKSVNFLKSCDPKHPSLEKGQGLLASLKHHPSVSCEELVKECVVDVKVLAGNSFEESIVSEEKEGMRVSVVGETLLEKCTSCEIKEEHNQETEPVYPSLLQVEAKIQEEDKIADSLPYEGFDDEKMVEKIIEEEKKKMRCHYKKLGEASDRRRLKAEWRSRRMMLRSGESASCSVVQENANFDESVSERVSMKGEASLTNNDGVEEGKSREEDMIEKDAGKESTSNSKVEEMEAKEVKVKESEGKLKVEESEEAMRDVIEMEVVNAVAETECEKEGIVDQIEKVEKEMDQECISDVPPSDVCLPFLKSPSRSHLKKLQGLFPFKTDAQEDNKENEIPEEWPYRSILLALMVQSSKMDAALLQWILVEKGLVSHLRSLRAYFFLLDGEFGRRLSEDLFSAMRRAPGGKPSIECLSELSLSRILSHALSSSTFAASDPNASLISLTLSQCPEKTQVGDPLACVHMQYKAPWPLNVVLTDEAVSKYSRVLDLLLRLRHASWALEQTFLHLRVLEPGKGIDKVFPRRSPREAVQNSPQYHQLQLYRHQMMHLVRSVQSYITSGVLQASGKKLDEIIAGSSCLDEFYTEHVQYVKKVLFGCMLNKHSETIANILNDILRLIMKFHWSLCSRSWHIAPHQGNKKTYHFEHPNFNVLHRIHEAFEGMTDFLLKYAWRLASHGYQASLFELLQMINVNNFY